LCDTVQDYLLIARPADEAGAAAPQAAGSQRVAERAPAYQVSAAAPERQPGNGHAPAPGASAPGAPQSRPAQPQTQPVPSRHLNIVLRRTGDLAQDTQRARQVYDMLTGKSGSGTFTVYIEDSRRRVKIDFPNASIAYSPALAQSLVAMLGRDAVQVV
jgi:hypothetical protein